MTTALIIPTRGRANRLKELMKNIKDTTEDYMIYFVIDPDDEDTCKLLLDDHIGNYTVVMNVDKVERTPSNYNLAYKYTTEEYLAILADDYLFHDGWLSDAIKKMGKKSVLAFGDKYAEGWGIFLVRSEYIEKYSGVIDEKNKIFHEYYHEFADAEFQFTARARNQIVYSNIQLAHRNPKRLGSQVNGVPQSQTISFHHPVLSEYDIQSIVKFDDRIDVTLMPRNPVLWDETYKKNSSQEKIEKDAQEFLSRAYLWGGLTKETIFKKDVV